MHFDSDVKFDVQLTGEGKVKFGYFSKAWKEVEEQKLFMLKFVGLSPEDKIGKVPIAGLVWAVHCLWSGCPEPISKKTKQNN